MKSRSVPETGSAVAPGEIVKAGSSAVTSVPNGTSSATSVPSMVALQEPQSKVSMSQSVRGPLGTVRMPEMA